MKAWRLAIKLLAHPLNDVVVSIHPDKLPESDWVALNVAGTDMGWNPSGVTDLVVDHENPAMA